jgi:5-methylcytosine-specific restriction endonuclease McrA
VGYSETRVLAIVATDRTFARQVVRGVEHWVGKCIFCNSHLVVGLDGSLPAGVTVEHIAPRHHGGTDDLLNLALACVRCNNEKGIRHDRRAAGDPRARAVVEKLLARRRQRYRDPEGASGA